ncbi:amidase [Caenimonas sedimenti]|uniref:Amidase n=1 Tax=Caenimonas sedimenti TaxID=2596921 RepID=A0A562ZRG0_9BURK|nr:amidase [Caenimonas sedimenti]
MWQLAAEELQRAYRSGQLTPLTAAHACLQRLDAVNPRINAVVARRDEAFLREAAASARRHAAGRPLSPLDGVPFTAKDNLPTHDLPTTWGTPALHDFRPEHDETAVARLRAAGALLLGKTNVPEFTLEGTTSNALFGTTRNPWDLRLTPGGSSGGAVAAVAAGIAPLALGTDGGGSTRRPAAHTGLVGFKPSIGVIARAHGLPPLLLDFEVVGLIARTVADTAMLLNVLRAAPGTDARDARRLRILHVGRMGSLPIAPEIADAVHAATRLLAGAGHVVESGPLPLDLSGFDRAWPQVAQLGLARLFEARPAWGAGASAKYREMAAQGAALPAARPAEIDSHVQALRREAALLFERIDVIVTPATAALPWPVEDAYPARIGGEPAGPRDHAAFTWWANAAGLPAIALPCRPSRAGLPIGLQLVGAAGSDDLLLALAAQLEQLQPWSGRWPDIA